MLSFDELVEEYDRECRIARMSLGHPMNSTPSRRRVKTFYKGHIHIFCFKKCVVDRETIWITDQRVNEIESQITKILNED